MLKHRDTEPWERLEGEGVKAYEAFSVYLELGEDKAERLHRFRQDPTAADTAPAHPKERRPLHTAP